MLFPSGPSIDSSDAVSFDATKLRSLRPSFKVEGGSVTAGNASSIGCAFAICSNSLHRYARNMITICENHLALQSLVFSCHLIQGWFVWNMKGSYDDPLKMCSLTFKGKCTGCKSKGIKLFGLLAAAGFIAAHASKNIPDEKWEKYSLATLKNTIT
ncbi:hypothetical protein E3N88_25765 [Mikania micrantha]|uniref:Thiolase N-terminal domain-containing protein n=1 Tax=Mikania micrantha TaxID=192012 RepID=A0A5N6N729_9ASTR|nr:hypothetical protein E3N88_25765 [Mikania micrantha]